MVIHTPFPDITNNICSYQQFVINNISPKLEIIFIYAYFLFFI